MNMSVYIYGWVLFYFVYYVEVDFLGCSTYLILNCLQTVLCFCYHL